MYSPKNKLNVNTKGLYINRTAKYFAPILRCYGKNFVKSMNKLRIKAFAIGDLNYSDSLTDYIYCVVNIYPSNSFSSVLEFLSNKEYFIDDYIFSLKNSLHCIVLKNPRPGAVDAFLKGKYSKMYSIEDIERFFLKTVVVNSIERYTDVYSVLTKRSDYDNIFIEKLNKEFNTTVNKLEESVEYDYTPIRGEEILNLEEESVLDLILQQQMLFENYKLII